MYNWVTAEYTNAYITTHDHGGYQDRNPSIIRLLKEAHESIKHELTSESKRIAICTNDHPPSPHNIPTSIADGNYKVVNISDTKDKAAFCMPCFLFDHWKDAGISDYETCVADIKAQSELPWETDKNKVFWIGAGTHHNRSVVCNIAANRPDLFQVSLMNWHNRTLSDSSFVSIPDHAKYSTLLDIEGAGYSARIKLLAFAKRPLIILDRDHWDWAASILKPDEHYILGARDGSDIISIAERIRDNRSDADAMAARCAAFAQANLTRAKAIEQTARIMLG